MRVNVFDRWPTVYDNTGARSVSATGEPQAQKWWWKTSLWQIEVALTITPTGESGFPFAGNSATWPLIGTGAHVAVGESTIPTRTAYGSESAIYFENTDPGNTEPWTRTNFSLFDDTEETAPTLSTLDLRFLGLGAVSYSGPNEIAWSAFLNAKATYNVGSESPVFSDLRVDPEDPLDPVDPDDYTVSAALLIFDEIEIELLEIDPTISGIAWSGTIEINSDSFFPYARGGVNPVFDTITGDQLIPTLVGGVINPELLLS